MVSVRRFEDSKRLYFKSSLFVKLRFFSGVKMIAEMQ